MEICSLIAIFTLPFFASDELKPLMVKNMQEGRCYASSERTDEDAYQGWALSDNKPVRPESWVERCPGEICLRAYPEKENPIDKQYQGFSLVLINDTNQEQSFVAQDSRLDIVQEALDKNGVWRPIEYLSNSRCGNSYHTLVLYSGQCWVFNVPRYQGPFATSLRFSLKKGEATIYSNIFKGSVHPKQFTVKQKRIPRNLMDPY